MARAVCKLVRNGNSTQLTIPSRILTYIGWLPGEQAVITVLEDKTLHVRKLTLDELGGKYQKPQVVLEPGEVLP